MFKYLLNNLFSKHYSDNSLYYEYDAAFGDVFWGAAKSYYGLRVYNYFYNVFTYYFGYLQKRWRVGRDCPYSRDYYYEHTDMPLFDPLGWNHLTWLFPEEYASFHYWSDLHNEWYVDWIYLHWRVVLDADKHGDTCGWYILFYFFISVFCVFIIHSQLVKIEVYDTIKQQWEMGSSAGIFTFFYCLGMWWFPYFMVPYDVVNFLTTDEVLYTLRVGRYMPPDWWREVHGDFKRVHHDVLLKDKHWDYVRQDWNPLRWIRIAVGTENIFSAGYGDWLENDHPNADYFLNEYVKGRRHKEALFHHTYEARYTPVDPRAVAYKNTFTADPRFPDPKPAPVRKWAARIACTLGANPYVFFWEDFADNKTKWFDYILQEGDPTERSTLSKFKSFLLNIHYPFAFDLMFYEKGDKSWIQDLYMKDTSPILPYYYVTRVPIHTLSYRHGATGSGFYRNAAEDHQTRQYYPSAEFKDPIGLPFYNYEYLDHEHDPTYGRGRRFHRGELTEEYGDLFPVIHPLSAPQTYEELTKAVATQESIDYREAKLKEFTEELKVSLNEYLAARDNGEITRDLEKEATYKEIYRKITEEMDNIAEQKRAVLADLTEKRKTRTAEYYYYDKILKERGYDKPILPKRKVY